LSKADAKTTAELYDFLYKDNSRIASYYAQAYSGNPTSLEQSKTFTETSEQGGEVDIQIASGDKRYSEETEEAFRSTIDPHDMRTTTILTRLSGLSELDHKKAAHGGLFRACGTLSFVDRYMLELGRISIETNLREAKRKHGKARDQAEIDNLELIIQLLPKLDLPSSFILRLTDGSNICGTIKDSGLEESITSYYFKHGAHGIPDVWMIGIKEVSTGQFGFAATDFLAATQQAANFLNSFLFPADASKATPVALFRKLVRKS
jgi:hypothetical protein